MGTGSSATAQFSVPAAVLASASGVSPWAGAFLASSLSHAWNPLMPHRLYSPACSQPVYLIPRRATRPTLGTPKMTRELKSETLEPLSGSERLMLFCVASRMDPAMAGLPHRTGELLVMKKLARRDQARLILTNEGRATLDFLLGGGGREIRDTGAASPRVRMLSSLALVRRRLIALASLCRRPLALGGRDGAVAVVLPRAHRGQSKHWPITSAAHKTKKPRRSGAKVS
jgi:hypothetical protein